MRGRDRDDRRGPPVCEHQVDLLVDDFLVLRHADPNGVEVPGGLGDKVWVHRAVIFRGGLPGLVWSDEPAAHERARLAGICLPAHRLGELRIRDWDDQHPGIRPQPGEGRLPAGRDRRGRADPHGQRDQGQQRQRRDGDRPAAPWPPRRFRGSRACQVQREREHGGGRAIGDDGEPVRENLAEHR